MQVNTGERLKGKKADKHSHHLNDSMLTREGHMALAAKLGILQGKKSLDDVTLQEYLNFYKKPLQPFAIRAIDDLTRIAAKKKSKKKQVGKEAPAT